MGEVKLGRGQRNWCVKFQDVPQNVAWSWCHKTLECRLYILQCCLSPKLQSWAFIHPYFSVIPLGVVNSHVLPFLIGGHLLQYASVSEGCFSEQHYASCLGIAMVCFQLSLQSLVESFANDSILWIFDFVDAGPMIWNSTWRKPQTKAQLGRHTNSGVLNGLKLSVISCISCFESRHSGKSLS